MSVFKAYDIRGTYPNQLDEDLARRIGGAFVKLINAKSLVVGRDMRSMAPSMQDAFIEGATRAGAKVIRIGLASTPMTYFAIGSLGVDGGVQVTASHNPAGYIGFKFCRKGCVPVSGETGITEMGRMVQEPEGKPAATPGTVTDEDVMEAYIDHVLSFASEIPPVKMVVDTANGMGGHALPHLLRRLPVEATVLFPELDGNFPNHEADPLKVENLKWLSEEVKKQRADLGVAYDGDADRVVFVDAMGNPVRSDYMTAALAEEFLLREPRSAVVYDLRSSRSTMDAIRIHGGKPIRERVGHSFIKATMRKEDAIFGGELSGHFYFRDNFVSDSGDIALVTLLTVLGKKGVSLETLVKPYDKYSATGEVNFRVENADLVFKRLKSKYSDGAIDELDGVTVQYKDWWFNVRKSNTEPLIRLNLEANTQELMDARLSEITPLIGAVMEGGH